MIKKMLMCADEVEINDQLHHPDWIDDPDRFAMVQSIRGGGSRIFFVVAGNTKQFSHRRDQTIPVLR